MRPPRAPRRLTPAGLQPRRMLARRRATAAALNLGSLALVLAGAAHAFGAGGWSVSDAVALACVAVGAPWTIMGFWNALIGLWLAHGRRDGLAAAAPHMAAADSDAPLRARVAVAMALRNEDAERALTRLAALRESLDATGQGAHFDLFVLSDSDRPEAIAAEEAALARLAPRLGPRLIYRRRPLNAGWKAGNIRDFLRRWGGGYELFLPLDSDSLMSGETVLRMTRIMQAHPRIGILQSLAVGAPARSAFARIFQFGMRHGMRSFTLGAAWWHGDCGPYWGHNALVRVAPFRRHCRLPRLPGRPPLGGAILSHDQVEAALMRRAGYECRVMPVEAGSWEENPPTLLDFTRRDLRWCQGNMQYWGLLGLRGLKPMSRFQLFAAIAMYLAAPAWMLMTATAAFKLLEGGAGQVDAAFAASMMLVMFSVSLFPKIAGWIDVALRPGEAARYGGRLRFAAGAAVETVFSMLMAPAVAFRTTLFLAGLAAGRSVVWGAQARDAYALGWGQAARGLWMQTLFGLGLAAAVWARAPEALPWAAPVLAGLCLAIPFAVLTAAPGLGRAMARARVCAVPEELAPPPVLSGVFDLEPGDGAAAGGEAAFDPRPTAGAAQGAEPGAGPGTAQGAGPGAEARASAKAARASASGAGKPPAARAAG
ncbi:glucans biosynthesis glucosyltransferase MdoH [Oceanicella actignis]|uniref:glucans biosynthesis glucosyltransferase MdoH n=1 Tax=Oceanicella actignis TaxID=1189325 RepID=UPI001C4347BC|nr:glucans biosynthesis glucosyltransferase MdoH [Oceanicella actignis]